MTQSLVLGLGSNLGFAYRSREKVLRQAIQKIVQEVFQDPEEIVFSRVFESAAMLPEGAPSDWNIPFLNLAIRGETSLDLNSVLSKVKLIERLFGRQSRERWAPRTLDIDLLWTSHTQIQTDRLQVPHPGLLSRPFMLWPFWDLLNPIEKAEFQKANAAKIPPWFSFAPMGQAPFETRLNLTSQRLIYGPELVGIVNVTPDSFSDGNPNSTPTSIIDRCIEMIRAGASVLDLGAESTRPGATPVPWEEEVRRLFPVLEGLKHHRSTTPFTLSIDTRHPETAEKVLENFLDETDWINDVEGLRRPRMRQLLAALPNPVVAMHSLDVPVKRENTLPLGVDPIKYIFDWYQELGSLLKREGWTQFDRIILDPGIGFGKTAAQSLELIRNLTELGSTPILLGHSRKSFLNLLTQKDFRERDYETLGVSLSQVFAAAYLRVHNVGIHEQALRGFLAASYPRKGHWPRMV